MIFEKNQYTPKRLLPLSETIFNVIVGFIAVLTFAKDRFDLVGILTGLGIGGLAIAFAAQKTLGIIRYQI